MDDAELARTMVTDAAELAEEMRRAGLDTERKTSAADLVTAADRAAEELVRGLLRRERPEDGLLGEEGSAAPSGNGRRWVVDPIDGTFNFVSGLTAWCSAVALEVDGCPTVAAVRHPASGETWVAADGTTTRDGLRIDPVPDRDLADSGVATFVNASHLGDRETVAVLGRVVRHAATVRMSGSGTVDLVDVAAGRLGLWIQDDCAPWDWLPGRALIEGAGGTTAVVEHRGRSWHLAGAPRAVAQAAERIRTPQDRQDPDS